MLQQSFVIDVEAKGAGGGVQIGAVDKEADAFLGVKAESHDISS